LRENEVRNRQRKNKTGGKSCVVCSCSKKNECGDLTPQWDEEPKQEIEMHSGTWTESQKAAAIKSKHCK
jgi:hypothetical protein